MSKSKNNDEHQKLSKKNKKAWSTSIALGSLSLAIVASATSTFYFLNNDKKDISTTSNDSKQIPHVSEKNTQTKSKKLNPPQQENNKAIYSDEYTKNPLLKQKADELKHKALNEYLTKSDIEPKPSESSKNTTNIPSKAKDKTATSKIKSDNNQQKKSIATAENKKIKNPQKQPKDTVTKSRATKPNKNEQTVKASQKVSLSQTNIHEDTAQQKVSEKQSNAHKNPQKISSEQTNVHKGKEPQKMSPAQNIVTENKTDKQETKKPAETISSAAPTSQVVTQDNSETINISLAAEHVIKKSDTHKEKTNVDDISQLKKTSIVITKTVDKKNTEDFDNTVNKIQPKKDEVNPEQYIVKSTITSSIGVNSDNSKTSSPPITPTTVAQPESRQLKINKTKKDAFATKETVKKDVDTKADTEVNTEQKIDKIQPKDKIIAETLQSADNSTENVTTIIPTVETENIVEKTMPISKDESTKNTSADKSISIKKSIVIDENICINTTEKDTISDQTEKDIRKTITILKDCINITIKNLKTLQEAINRVKEHARKEIEISETPVKIENKFDFEDKNAFGWRIYANKLFQQLIEQKYPKQDLIKELQDTISNLFDKLKEYNIANNYLKLLRKNFPKAIHRPLPPTPPKIPPLPSSPEQDKSKSKTSPPPSNPTPVAQPPKVVTPDEPESTNENQTPPDDSKNENQIGETGKLNTNVPIENDKKKTEQTDQKTIETSTDPTQAINPDKSTTPPDAPRINLNLSASRNNLLEEIQKGKTLKSISKENQTHSIDPHTQLLNKIKQGGIKLKKVDPAQQKDKNILDKKSDDINSQLRNAQAQIEQRAAEEEKKEYEAWLNDDYEGIHEQYPEIEKSIEGFRTWKDFEEWLEDHKGDSFKDYLEDQKDWSDDETKTPPQKEGSSPQKTDLPTAIDTPLPSSNLISDKQPSISRQGTIRLDPDSTTTSTDTPSNPIQHQDTIPLVPIKSNTFAKQPSRQKLLEQLEQNKQSYVTTLPNPLRVSRLIEAMNKRRRHIQQSTTDLQETKDFE